MSNTGTYKYVDGEVIKVSDEIPRIGWAASDQVPCRVEKPFYCHNMGDQPVLIKSRKHFCSELKKRGLRLKGPKRGGWDAERPQVRYQEGYRDNG